MYKADVIVKLVAASCREMDTKERRLYYEYLLSTLDAVYVQLVDADESSETEQLSAIEDGD